MARALVAWSMSACVACGRIGFGAATGANDRPLDAAVDTVTDTGIDAAPPAHVAYVAPFYAHDGGTGREHTFIAQARTAGDAIVIQVACAGTQRPGSVALIADGWSFQPLSLVTQSGASNENAVAFFAIAPDTVGTTFTVTWTGSQCDSSTNDVGDEFTLDPPGGTIVVDGVAWHDGSGDCLGTVSTSRAGDAVWAACDSAASVTGRGLGFSPGADDAVGDWSEYKLISEPPPTDETVRFSNPLGGYVLSMVTLAPALK